MIEARVDRPTMQELRAACRERDARYAREVFGPASDEFIFLLLTGTPADEAQRRSDETYDRLREAFKP